LHDHDGEAPVGAEAFRHHVATDWNIEYEGLMKKSGLAAIAASMLLACTGCTVVSPDAGQQAVLIDKPVIFGHGGVRAEPVLTGLTYTWFSTHKIYVNMFPQQYDGNFSDLMSSDGVPLDFHAIIRLQVTDPVALVKNFGQDWYKNNVEQEFFNRVRSAVKKHGMNETAIQTTAIDEIDSEVSREMTEYLNQNKLPIRLLKITVGKANPPDAVRNQRVETAQQEQRVLTEQKRDLAEQSRKAAEQSRAEADNAYRLAMNLSPAQFVEMERIKMQTEVCAVKDAKCTFIIGSAVDPVVNVK
jgi:regulator of protease activity HflC (stomatin/prohibitin superfamily)